MLGRAQPLHYATRRFTFLQVITLLLLRQHLIRKRFIDPDDSCLSVVASFLHTIIVEMTEMKVAVPIWEGRVASVLDFSQKLILVELEDGGEQNRVEVPLSGRNTLEKVAELRQLGVEVLICGAVSQPMASAATSFGIQLVPYVTGAIDEVLDAYQDGRLGLRRFALPGRWLGTHRGRRGWRCGRRGPHQ
jgi:predicted Fe-Mo cluster-binding NifX family protein